MAKPWAKIEVGYWDHIKFQSLSANAICLWHEGKNYCDKNRTDGLLPLVAVKRFRFYGVKAVQQLTTSCETPKPDGTPHAPLWEPHPVGFKMHDYLEHNDCREAIEARMDKAEQRRAEERARKAEWRAKKAARDDVPPDVPRDKTGHVPNVPEMSRSTTEAVPEPVPVPAKSRKNTAPAAADAPHPVKRFLALYEELFSGLFDEKPHIVQGRDAKIAKDVILKHGESKAGELLRAFFDSQDKFIRGSGYGLNMFAGQINRLIVDLSSARPARNVWICRHLEECSHRAMCAHKDSMPEKYAKRAETEAEAS